MITTMQNQENQQIHTFKKTGNHQLFGMFCLKKWLKCLINYQNSCILIINEGIVAALILIPIKQIGHPADMTESH